MLWERDYLKGGIRVREIKGYDTFAHITQIHKGWSDDQKYFIETNTNEHLLLRIAAYSHYEKKAQEVEMLRLLHEKGLPIPRPLHYGTCHNGKSVYVLFTWCAGEDATDVLPTLSQDLQYTLGVESGNILRTIHSLPAPNHQENWEQRFQRKVKRNIHAYERCGVAVQGAQFFKAFVQENQHILTNRPQTFQHGDFHIGNMVISGEDTLHIIDFNRHDFGDPWEEFNRIVWSAHVSPAFATGQLQGYFQGEPPKEFFTALAFYISSNALASIPWSIPFGERQIDVMKDQMEEVLGWYNHFQTVIPNWYKSGS